MKCCFNGDIISREDWQPHADDRAFRYGDGLFETMTAFAERPRNFERHLMRLHAGMKRLRMNGSSLPPAAALISIIATLREQNGIDKRARVKLTCWRKEGGLYAPEQNGIHWLLEVSEGKAPSRIIEQAGLARGTWVSHGPLSAYKRMSADEYVLAALECQQRGMDDLLLCDRKGNLAEALYANIFWFDGQRWFTPAKRTGCIVGVMRGFVIDYLRSKGVAVKKGRFAPDVLDSATIVLNTNASGIRYYQKVEEHHFMTKDALIDELIDAIECEV